MNGQLSFIHYLGVNNLPVGDWYFAMMGCYGNPSFVSQLSKSDEQKLVEWKKGVASWT